MENSSSKLLLPEAASWSGKLSKVAPQSCYPKLFPGAAPKAVLQSCCPKAAILHPKRLPKAILQSGFRKLRFKGATRCCCPKLLPQSCNLSNLYTKNGSPKLFCKAAPESCSRKLLLKAAPEVVCIAAPERCCSLKQKCPESCSGQLANAAPHSCCPKLLPESCDSSNL